VFYDDEMTGKEGVELEALMHSSVSEGQGRARSGIRVSGETMCVCAHVRVGVHVCGFVGGERAFLRHDRLSPRFHTSFAHMSCPTVVLLPPPSRLPQTQKLITN